MSEQLMVCKALAAMMGNKGDVTEEEVKFVGLAAFELGLELSDNQEVQKVLKEGGDYMVFLKEVTSKPMRTYLFRRVVAAVLLDDHIDKAEQALINDTAEHFGYEPQLKDDFIAWMKEGIDWEKRGAELLARM
jgi:hypothetical protein